MTYFNMSQTEVLTTDEDFKAFFNFVIPLLETAFWFTFLVVAFQIRNAARKCAELLEDLKKKE